MFCAIWALPKERPIVRKSKVLPENFDEIKEQFLIDVRSVIEMEDVPLSLVLNWDHTAMKIVPSSN